MDYALDGYGDCVGRRVFQEIAPLLGGDALSLLDEQRIVEIIEQAHAGLISMPEAVQAARAVLGGADADTSALEAPPELLSSLARRGDAGPMGGLALSVATAAKLAFDRLQRGGLPLQLTHCYLAEDGRGDDLLILGVCAPDLALEARPGDLIASGAVLLLKGQPDGAVTLSVRSRLFRKLCHNGAVIPEDLEATSSEVPLPRSSEDLPLVQALIEGRLRAIFDVAWFSGILRRVRQAASAPLRGDRWAVLNRLPPDQAAAAEHQYQAHQDFTRWGLVNAVSGRARFLADSAAALEVEETAAELAWSRWSDEPAERLEARPVSAAPGPASAEKRPPAPVLVVDDEEDIRCIVSSLLEAEGFEVHTASDGREALDLLSVIRRPSLVLLDSSLPTMSGGDVLKAMRADPALASIPVVVLAIGPVRDMAGAQQILRKPFDLQALLNTVGLYSGAPAGAPERRSLSSPGTSNTRRD